MPDEAIDIRMIEVLRNYDTPTICNALELLDTRFRSGGFTVDPLVCAFPKLPPMVGFARTVTIRAGHKCARSDEDERRFLESYWDYVSDGSLPKVAVVQDLDDRHRGKGAMWGEVNSTIHKSLGCSGVITNGSVRDLRGIAPDFQLLAGSVAPSHAHVHYVHFNVDVTVAGLVFSNEDLVHADEHGAVVIPRELAGRIPDAAELIIRREKVVLDACRAPGFSVTDLKRAARASAQIH
jgi:regulator of RNase E activity RraA